MYKGKKILCVIPARGGSKELPGKNIKKLLGKPLIAYSIEQAKNSKYIDRVIVSTDSHKIANISKKYHAELPFIRPRKLAGDNSSTIDVLLHAVDLMEKNKNCYFGILVLLHATSPLRTVEDIDRCIELLFKKKADNVISVTESHRNPYFNMIEISNVKKIKLVKRSNFVTRQSAPRTYDINASIYVWKMDIFKKIKKILLKNTQIYIMPKERSIDIDDNLDFRIAEMTLKDRNKNRVK